MTQPANIDVDIQKLRTHKVDDIENEVVPDSDEEGMHTTEVVSDSLSSFDTWRNVKGDRLDLMMIHVAPVNQQSYAGYFRRWGSAVGAHPLQSNSSPRSSLTCKGGDTVHAGTRCQKQHVKVNGISRLEDQKTVHTKVMNGDQDFNGTTTSFIDEGKTSNMLGRFSTGDVFTKKKVSSSSCMSMERGEDTSLVTCDEGIETLSYIESQEPEEPSEANTLDFVDQYLSVIDVNLSHKVGHGKASMVKSPPALSIKGPQSLASITKLKPKAPELAAFDFIESQTDRREDALLSQGQQLDCDGIERDVPDIFDVGLDTQMAAEAMEALVYAPPTKSHVGTHQSLENKHEESLTGAMENKASKHCPLPEPERAGSQVFARLSSRTKRPTNKLRRNMTSSRKKHDKNQKVLDPELPLTKKVARGKSQTKKHLLNFKNTAAAKDGLCEGSSMAIAQIKELGTREGENIKEEEIEGKLWSSSPVARRTSHGSSLHSLKRSEGPTCNSGERINHVLEVDVLKSRRKRSNLDTDVCQILDERRKCPKLSSDTSREATRSKVIQKQQKDSDFTAITSYSKSYFWIYPKGKRTCRSMLRNSKGANKVWASSTPIFCENDNNHCLESLTRSEGNSKATCFSSNVEKKSSFTPQYKVASENKRADCFYRQNFVEPSSEDVINYNSVVEDGQMLHMNLDRSKASGQSGKLRYLENIKSSVSSNVNIKVLSVDKNKEPCKKKFSRSPLVKELARLGFPESLPDFVPKELRRRRNTANVSVLFSQSLDNEIIKHQRKILLRLGVSVVSCCSDATHFITERFVRTRNMLEAIALGKPVVTHLWLENCVQASCLIDERNYILRDAKKEKEIGFSMPVSLARARQHPLLKGQKVFITPNVKPSKEMVENLVKTVHGQAVDKIETVATKDKMIPDDLLILSCEQDYGMCKPFLDEGAAIYSSEILLNGIVIQKLEYQRHQLFTNHVKRKPLIIYRRKYRHPVAQC